MIYDNITKTINDFLGGNFIIEYANDYSIDWKKILPEVQDKISYGVVRVDSATTQQVGGQTIRIEQASLKVAIPCEKAIFNEAVALLRSMLNTYPNGLNQLPIADTDETSIPALKYGVSYLKTISWLPAGTLIRVTVSAAGSNYAGSVSARYRIGRRR